MNHKQRSKKRPALSSLTKTTSRNILRISPHSLFSYNNIRVTTRRMLSEANGEDVVLDDWARSRSKTKAILESMIIKGEIPDDNWPPARVYELKHEFKKTHYKRLFVSGLRRLRKEIKMRKVRVNFDRQAIDHDRRLYPAATITQQGFPRWPGSEAHRFMKQDIKNEVHWRMTPAQFYERLLNRKLRIRARFVFIPHLQ